MAIAITCRHGTNCAKCCGRISKPTNHPRKAVSPIVRPQYHNLQDNGTVRAMVYQHHINIGSEHIMIQRPNTSSCLLETLPQELVNMIAKQLPYETLLVLQTLSRTLRRIIDPQLASEASKLSLVMRAEKDGTHNFCVRPPRQRRGTAAAADGHHHPHPDDHHRQQQRLGCFSCYRVLAMGAFAAEQLARDPFAPATAPAPFLRRYCVPCGLARGWHYPGEVIERRDGSTWWVCQCRRAWDKSTTLSCRHCGSEFDASSIRLL
jgi:hypothetical protein